MHRTIMLTVAILAVFGNTLSFATASDHWQQSSQAAITAPTDVAAAEAAAQVFDVTTVPAQPVQGPEADTLKKPAPKPPVGSPTKVAITGLSGSRMNEHISWHRPFRTARRPSPAGRTGPTTLRASTTAKSWQRA